MRYLWLPLIEVQDGPVTVHSPDMPAVKSWQCAICGPVCDALGALEVSTVPVLLPNDADAALCANALSAEQIPAQDKALYADALVKLVPGALTQTQAEAVATALGLPLDG